MQRIYKLNKVYNNQNENLSNNFNTIYNENEPETKIIINIYLIIIIYDATLYITVVFHDI